MLFVSCIANEHNPWLVGLAAAICVLGAWITLRLFGHARIRGGRQRFGWIFLASVAGGSSIWCTHFIAMLAYTSPTAISFEPILTMVSLMAAIGGCALGLHLALAVPRWPEVGGAIVGIGVASMHYIGMRAYLVDAVLLWDATYVSASWVISIVFAGLAIGQAVRSAYRHAEWVALLCLTLAVVGMHFTGMASLLILPNTVGTVTDPAVLIGMAVAVAGGAVVIVATGIASHLIDEDATKENVEHLRFLAHYDNLTRLPNRATFVQRLSEALHKAKREPTRVAVIGMDLNRFKEINDTRGHVAGDQVLRAIGERFNRVCLPGECLWRTRFRSG